MVLQFTFTFTLTKSIPIHQFRSLGFTKSKISNARNKKYDHYNNTNDVQIPQGTLGHFLHLCGSFQQFDDVNTSLKNTDFGNQCQSFSSV